MSVVFLDGVSFSGLARTFKIFNAQTYRPAHGMLGRSPFLKKWAKSKRCKSKIIRASEIGASLIQCNQPKDVKPKMREDKLRSGVHWQEAIKHKGVK